MAMGHGLVFRFLLSYSPNVKLSLGALFQAALPYLFFSVCVCLTVVKLPIATLNNNNLQASNPHAESGRLF